MKKSKTSSKHYIVLTFIFTIVFGLLILPQFLSAQYKCQYDNFPLNNTGKTKIEWGKLVYLYKCSAEHNYWIAAKYGSYGMDIGDLKTKLPSVGDSKEVSQADQNIASSGKFVMDFVTTTNHMKKTKSLGFQGDKVQSITTRQIPGAKRLYKKCAPGVVLLVSLDAASLGSGAIINEKGEIITNWHVVTGQEQMLVWFHDPKITSLQELDPDNYAVAEVIATDPSRDLAMLKLTGTKHNLTHLEFGHDHQLSIAQDVFAIGHPEAYIWSFTYGVVSQLRNNYEWSYEGSPDFKANVIQTQTPTNPGNSGGPLFDEKGRLIGINSFGTPKSEGLNFAVRVGEVRKFVREVRQGKHEPQKISVSKVSSEEPVWDQVDSDNNGVIDVYRLDINGDGYYDLAQVDENEDEVVDYIVGDSNNDHKIDMMIYDNDGNGTFEYFLIDTNYDGEWDTEGIDTDGDWEPDAFFAYTGS